MNRLCAIINCALDPRRLFYTDMTALCVGLNINRTLTALNLGENQLDVATVSVLLKLLRES